MVIEQLVYNEIYAPNYPREDNTNLTREESRILMWLDGAIGAVRREDIGDWLRLGRSSIEQAFAKVRSGDENGSTRDFQFAVQYLRNALARKPHKVDFVVKPGGAVIVPPSQEAESQD